MDTDASFGDGRVLAGKCECGTVRYRVADAVLYAANCHCSRCRAATGSAFKPFAGIEREKLEITTGGDALLIVRACSSTRSGVSSSVWYQGAGAPPSVARIVIACIPAFLGGRASSSSE